MLSFLLLFCSQPVAPSIGHLDELAAAKDVATLNGYLTGPTRSISPFAVMRGGGYDVGKFGWHAFELKTVDGKSLVVFSTPLTSEDTGDLVFERVEQKLRFIPEDLLEGVTIKNHDFDLRFNVPNNGVEIRDDVTFDLEKKTKPAFLMRFSPCYKVTRIESGGKPVRFAQAAGVVSVETPENWEDHKMRIDYVAKVILPSYAGSIGPTEATLTNDYWYPMIARQPATYHVKIHGPKDWTAVAQGELVQTQNLPDERVTEYQMDLPVTYYSISAAPYRTFSQNIHGRQYRVWSMHMSADEMRDQTELYAPILEFYEQHFSKFPFSGFGAVVSDVYGGGALEAYSFATSGDVPGEDAHEPSHTWWGGIVDNSYLHSFWNESFADYCEELYRREVPIGNTVERRLAYVATPKPSQDWDTASMQDSGAEFGKVGSSLGYGKGAFVLYMLEQEIGIDGVYKAMQTWIADHRKDRSAEWDGFEAAVKKSTGKDYTWFFDQWIRRPGIPDLGVSNLHYEHGFVGGRFNLNGPAYRMPVEVMLEDASGARTFTTLRVDSTDQSFSIESAKKPILVSFDPWMKLLRKTHADEARLELGKYDGNGTYRDQSHPEYAPSFSSNLQRLPQDLAGVTLIGSPATLPAMAPLCAKVGFVVKGDTLTYHSTTIDLKAGMAESIVDLGGGKTCRIILGNAALEPDPNHACTMVTDRLGRFLDGHTEPKRSGYLTFRL